MLGKVHAIEKSMFAVKPDGLIMVWPYRPPYQSAGFVENLGNHPWSSLHVLDGGGGGEREWGEWLTWPISGNAFTRPRWTYRPTTSDDWQGVPRIAGKTWIFKRRSFPLPDQGGEPRTVVRVVLGILRHSFKLNRVPVGKNLKMECEWMLWFFYISLTWSKDCFVPKRFSKM